MYGYETNLDYTPATEASFIEWARSIGEFIINSGKKIWEYALRLRSTIKNFFATKIEDSMNEIIKSSYDAIEYIGDIVTDMLDDCIDCINILHKEYLKVGVSDDFDASKGMGKLNENNSPTVINAWKEAQNTLAAKFKKCSKLASDIKIELHLLSTFARADVYSKDILKLGYATLNDIFVHNKQFGDKWKTIVMAQDWSTGKIRSYLTKIVDLYKVGINTTNTFGRLLTKQGVRKYDHTTETDSGLRIVEERDVNVNNKPMTPKDIRKAAGKESVDYIIDDALESAYDSGYEKAMHDMEIYNDIAMEGPARDYRHRQNEGKSREEIQASRKYKRDYNGTDPKYSIGTHSDIEINRPGQRHFRSKNAKKLYLSSNYYIKHRDNELKYSNGGTGSSNWTKVDNRNLRKKYADKKIMSNYNGKYGDTINNSNLDPAAKAALHKKYMDKYKDSDEYKAAHKKYYEKAFDLQKKLDDDVFGRYYAGKPKI